MATAYEESDLTFEQVLQYFRDNGGSVRNRDVVTSFKKYLTDPLTKDDARVKFKEYVNKLAVSKIVNGEKFLYLKTRYLQYQCPSSPVLPSSPRSTTPGRNRAPPPPLDPMNSLGIPLSPLPTNSLQSKDNTTPSRQPPPYRPPPPVVSPSPSLDTVSLSSFSLSMQEIGTPQPPPRRKSSDKLKLGDDDSSTPTTPTSGVELRKKDEVLDESKEESGEEKEANVSVKERTQKFNRLASVEGDERSPRSNKTPERTLKSKGVDEEDGASVTSILEPKKCVEWYVTASKGDCQELLKLAKDEPRLVNRKDPFTAYTVLHWGAKHGNAEIIKAFAGTYKVDVNTRTNGGYTPLHVAAIFGHKDIFKLLIEVYKANSNVRDYRGRTPEYYLLAKEKTGPKNNVRKLKRGKKQSEKDLGFLRIGSLNVRVKKTTEAFSNFLGVGSGSVNPMDSAAEKIHKGWGSADNVNSQEIMPAPKGYIGKKKSKYNSANISNSTPTTPKQSRGMHFRLGSQDSDSDTAAGFDNQWKK